MKKFLKIIFVILLVLGIAGAAYGGYIYYTVNKGVNSSFSGLEDKSKLREDGEEVDIEDSFTVLILGIDENEKRAKKEQLKRDEFRTDTMILATFDREGNVIKMINIPRDTLSLISDEQAFDKINHAHALGGIEGAVDSVENLLNVPVDFYIRVNFDSVVDIVNTLGGVEFDVPFDMEEPNQDDSGKIKVKKGKRMLTGEEALAVVRSRRVDSDFGRGERQMQMIQAIMNRSKSTGAITKIDDLVDVVSKNVTHNFTMQDITKLAKYFASNDIDFEQTRVLGEDYIGYTGAYYYKPSEEHLFVLSRTLREILDLKAPDVNDFANIRLSYWLNPTVLIGEDIINNYKLEGEDIPFFADPAYKSKYGDGFNIPKEQLENYEDNEGDTDVSQPDGQDYTEPTEEEYLDESNDDDYYYNPGTNPRDEYFPPERDDRENYE
ncbi:LCP family protein [Nosocomiicoccus massiliensis]|uniref:LCP family protein n=1 Tax=Nosocomiicoccus massiliensis TaxID=1232430 RepID=A0AAF0YI96_9STAP|nr:LCP family protein [Nosocomiicoccus massiliensis]WOS96138.1 LCP family protein [Nosocomiicoccus massiliensis]